MLLLESSTLDLGALLHVTDAISVPYFTQGFMFYWALLN